MNLGDLTLRTVPVVSPQSMLSEALALLADEPLKTLVLVGDEMYMGIFNEEARTSGQIPRKIDPETLAVGPYALSMNNTGNTAMPVEDALAMMHRRSIAVLPVVDKLMYKGVVTLNDLENAV